DDAGFVSGCPAKAEAGGRLPSTRLVAPDAAVAMPGLPPLPETRTPACQPGSASRSISGDFSSPAGLELHRSKIGVTDPGHAGEETVAPLADRIDLVERLVRQTDFPDQGLEFILAQMVGDRHPVQRTKGFDRLRQHFEHRIVYRAAGVVGIDAGDFLVPFVEGADVRRVGDAADPEYIFGAGAVLLREALERTADRTVISLDVEVFDLRLIGKTERVGRIRPGNERVWIGGPGGLDDRRVVLGAERIGFVIHDLEAGLFEQRPPRIGEF